MDMGKNGPWVAIYLVVAMTVAYVCTFTFADKSLLYVIIFSLLWPLALLKWMYFALLPAIFVTFIEVVANIFMET